jgi:3-hydroxyacyl-[acyl-carrier-protein] dehydratase
VRFYLFDRVLEAERGKRMVATKVVDLMDEFFCDHYPLRPVMPATMVLEAIAQASGMLNNYNHNFAVEMVLMLMDGVRLYRPVTPGDRMTLEVNMVYDHPYGATLRGEASVEGERIATVERIAFAHEAVKDPKLIEINRDRFVYQSGGFGLAKE